MSLTLLHIADVHLDAPFRWLGGRGQEQRRQLKETFRHLVDLALAEGVDALLVAGDLFDSNSPAQDTVDLVATQFARLSCPVFVLPGTHDCLDAACVYRRAELQLPNLHLFQPERTAFPFDQLGLVVHGRANCARSSRLSPLAGLRPDPSARYNVALAHGSLAIAGAEDDFPLSQADLAGAGMDYVALGHWHSYRQCAGPRACYSGPLELLGEGEVGGAVLVKLGQGETGVELRPLSRRHAERVTLTLDGIASAEELATNLRGRQDPDLALDVTLGGVRPLALALDLEALRRELEPYFFAVRLADRSHSALGTEEIAALPEGTVAGQFARRLAAQAQAAVDDAERRRAEAALQVGLALLQGRRVL